ncbi:MAG: S8 family serine peptidase, partial [Chloroflexota bacterium]|nr:S8 family serine peptidase [Chloroflexota bacterium]
MAIVSAGLLLATLAPAASAAEPRPDGQSLRAFPEMIEELDRHRVDSSDKARPQGQDRLTSVIVKLDLVPLAAYDGGVQGLAPTQDLVAAQRTDAAARGAIASYERYAADVQGAFERRLKAAMPNARITHRLTWVLGGVSAIVPFDRLAQISRMPGVVTILRDELEQVDTDRSPEFIGAPTTWSRLGGQQNAGQGVVVGVLDTGIWPEHDSYSDPDPAGKAYAAPPPAPDGDRACEFNEGTQPGAEFTCNNKLIGADRFMATYDAFGPDLLPGEFTDARDDNGHGTHTSSTAAGNRAVDAEIFGVDRGTVSGIAPRAHVIMYKVCGDQGCFSSDSAAAVQEAIQDGVDVINFSISGGGNPYSDAVSLAFLDAYAAGVFVAASAGNSGPGADTVAHREPWVTTVGASTTDRHFVTDVTISSSSASDLTFEGASLTDGISSPTDLVNAAEAPYNDPQCLNSTADSAFAGKVVICVRGGTGRIAKGFNVRQRGAVGMILYNNAANVTDLETDNHWLPAAHIQFDDGQDLLAYYAANPDAAASWPPGAPTTVQGDVMASFSSRGGPDQSLGISKPDVTAPGVQILAGHTPDAATSGGGPPGQLFQAIAGTSMSSPHVAGAAALLADLKPGWAPGQIKSALMTTGFQKVFKEDSVTRTDPFDDGSGRIDLRKAHEPGITFSAFAPQFFLNQHDLSRVNYPSVYVPDMPG